VNGFKRLVSLYVAGFVLTTSCGGQLSGPPTADGAVAQDASAADGPAADSITCNRPDGTCEFCDDGMWHCGASIFSQCPANLDSDASCIGVIQGSNDCFSCGSNYVGDDWHCTSVNPHDGYWTLTEHSCSH